MSESECEEAARFAEGVLAEALDHPVPRLLRVSATGRLAGTRRDDDWAGLREALERLARDSGADLVRAAGRREIDRLTARLLASAEEQRLALVSPLEESERRMADLESSLADAGAAMSDLGYLLQAEVDRLARRFEKDRSTFLADSLPAARAELRDVIGSLPDPKLRTLAHDAASTLARARLEAWVARETNAAERLYREASARFIELANEFLSRFLGSNEVGFSALPQAFASEKGFRVRSQLYFTELVASTTPSTASSVFDRLWFATRVRRAVESSAERVFDRLLFSNSSRVQFDLTERVCESRRKLESEIRARLSEALRSASAAIERARTRQAAGDEGVKAELARLELIRQRLLYYRLDGRG